MREGLAAHEGQQELLEALRQLLRDEGAPAGVSLLDVMRVRRSLAQADSLLRKIQDALVEGLEVPLDEPGDL